MVKKDLEIKSKRQQIRLWFECYQLCLEDKKYKDNLKKSKSFYKNWGLVKGIEFSKWYNDKEYLFENLKVKEIDKIFKNPNTINISIPINQTISKTLKDVKKLVESKRSKEFNFEYTTNFKGVFRYINLEIYKIWIKLGKIPINREFLIKVRKDFDSRPKSKIKDSMFLNLPSMKKFETQFPTNVSLDNQIRTVRRGIKEVEKTIENVSKGKFP
jgi:hypothetical protein